MNKNIKKILLTAGIATMGLAGAKIAIDGANEKDTMVKIEYARDVLNKIEEKLASDTLNPQERHELILTRETIAHEIQESARRLSAKNRARVMPQVQNLRIPDVILDKELQR